MYNQIAANKRQTIFMMFIFVILVGGLGWLLAKFLGSPSIWPFILIASVFYALISYFSGAGMALAVNGAKENTR